MKPPPVDPYRTLGVTADASPDQIGAAYRALVLKHHPDRSGQPEASARFIEVQRAYKFLSDASLRAQYDEHVRQLQRRREAEAEGKRQQQRERDRAAREKAEAAARIAAAADREARDQRPRAEAQAPRGVPPLPPAADDIYAFREPPEHPPRGRAMLDEAVDELSDQDDADVSPAIWAPTQAGGTAQDHAIAAAAIFALLMMVGCAAYYVLSGHFLGLFLTPVVLVLSFVAGLAVAYPLAGVAVAVIAVGRTLLAPAREIPPAVGADLERARVIRLVISFSIWFTAGVATMSAIAWIGLAWAPGQPATRREWLEPASGLAALIVGLSVATLTFRFLFAVLDGRPGLWSASSTSGREGVAAPRSVDRRRDFPQRERRGSVEQAHAPAA